MGETTDHVVQQDGAETDKSADGISTDQHQQADGGDGRVAALEAELARIRAKARELEGWKSERESADANAERQAQLAAGKHETVIADLQAKLAAVDARRAELEATENARIERVQAGNEKRLKALPADLRVLVPDGLSPDVVADQLGRLERLAQQQARPGGGRSGTGTGAPDIPADCMAEADRHYIGDKPERYTPDEWRRFYFDHVWNTPKRQARRRRVGS